MICDIFVGFILLKFWKYFLYIVMYGVMSNVNEVISNGILVFCLLSIFVILIENNIMIK